MSFDSCSRSSLLRCCPSLGPAPSPATTAAGHWEGAIHAPRRGRRRLPSISRPTTPASSAARSAIRRRDSKAFRYGARAVDGEAVKLELKTGGPGVQNVRRPLVGRRPDDHGAVSHRRARRAVHAEAHRRGADRAAAAQRCDRRRSSRVVGRLARRRRPVVAARADADESRRPNLDGHVGTGGARRLPSPSLPKAPR